MTRRPEDHPHPLHSNQSSRTRPTRRRRPRPRSRPSSNRRRQALLSRYTLLFGILVGVTALGGAILRTRTDPSSEGLPTAPAGAVAVQVLEIIDGDTLEVEDAAGEPLRVRLFGIDTPERGEACYDEATDRMRELAGSEVLLLADERLQDPGGRELRYVYTEDGVSIDAALLNEGLAVAWTEDGALRDELMAIERDAREANRGCLWSAG